MWGEENRKGVEGNCMAAERKQEEVGLCLCVKIVTLYFFYYQLFFDFCII